MSNVFKPVVEAKELFAQGDWRPILGDAPRKDDWKCYMLGKEFVDKRRSGIILPSFDWNLSMDDKAFQSSVAPCWSDEADKNSPRHFTPNAFAIPMWIYPFLGEKKEHWLSPTNRATMIGRESLDKDDAADAFHDLASWVRRNAAYSKEKKKSLLESDSMLDEAPVPGRSMRYFALCKCKDKDTPWHLAVVAMTTAAYSYIIEQMRWDHYDRKVKERDPNWPQYLLGDPTDTSAALEWRVEKRQVNPKDHQETNVPCFTNRREILDDDQRSHIISAEDLSKRFLLPDPANWNIPEYEDQVEHMIQYYSPEVTIDMIRAACSYRYRGEMPTARPERIVVTTKADEVDEARPTKKTSLATEEVTTDDYMAAVTKGPRLAPSGQPPMPPPAPVAPVAEKVDNTTYIAGRPKQKTAKYSVAQLQELVDSGEYEGLKVYLGKEAGKDVWKSIETCGLVKMPSVSDEDDMPSVPDEDDIVVPDEDVSAVPEEESSSQTKATKKGKLTLEQMHARLFPNAADYDAFSDAIKKKADDLVKKAWELTDHGSSDELPEVVIAGLLDLMQDL